MVALLALLLLALLSGGAGGADDGGGPAIGACPKSCTCKWKGGKPTVECVNASLASVPTGLDGDTQVLDLSLNYLPRLESGLFADRAGLPNLQKVYLAGCATEEVEDHCFRSEHSCEQGTRTVLHTLQDILASSVANAFY